MAPLKAALAISGSKSGIRNLINLLGNTVDKTMAIKKKGGDPVPKKGPGPKSLPQVTVSASRIYDTPAKKPSTINKRAPLMDVPVGKKGSLIF